MRAVDEILTALGRKFSMKTKVVLKYQLFTRTEDGLLKRFMYSEYESSKWDYFNTLEEAVNKIPHGYGDVLILPVATMETDWDDE